MPSGMTLIRNSSSRVMTQIENKRVR